MPKAYHSAKAEYHVAYATTNNNRIFTNPFLTKLNQNRVLENKVVSCEVLGTNDKGITYNFRGFKFYEKLTF